MHPTTLACPSGERQFESRSPGSPVNKIIRIRIIVFAIELHVRCFGFIEIHKILCFDGWLVAESLGSVDPKGRPCNTGKSTSASPLSPDGVLRCSSLPSKARGLYARGSSPLTIGPSQFQRSSTSTDTTDDSDELEAGESDLEWSCSDSSSASSSTSSSGWVATRSAFSALVT
jgi:hypothetical protein